jgi:hypothetical protein
MENLKFPIEIWDCFASCIFSNQSFEKRSLKIAFWNFAVVSKCQGLWERQKNESLESEA